MSINERIKEVRKACGISQAKFADRIAISSSYISDLENSTREVNERIFHLVTAKFNVNEHWLRTGQGTMFNDDTSAVIIEVINIMKSLAPSVQKSALRILNVLTEIDVSMKNL